jgi:hypothetical protein
MEVDGETTRIDKDRRECKGMRCNNVDGRPPMGGVVDRREGTREIRGKRMTRIFSSF